MKRNSEREELLTDVLAPEGQLRNATLKTGLNEMRRLGKQRRAARVVAIACVPVVVFAAMICAREFLKATSLQDPPSHVARAEELIPGTSIQVLNDEQLLDIFKGRPVALVGQPGNQRLLLLDERN